MKNPYKSETPSWHLFELMKSAEGQANAFGADAQRFTEKSNFQRDKAETLKKALEQLKEEKDNNGTDGV